GGGPAAVAATPLEGGGHHRDPGGRMVADVLRGPPPARPARWCGHGHGRRGPRVVERGRDRSRLVIGAALRALPALLLELARGLQRLVAGGDVGHLVATRQLFGGPLRE